MDQTVRDNRFDNLKGIMIFLVLFCHFIEKMYGSWGSDPATKYLYYAVYHFHMPVFIFISGYFSKNKDPDKYYRNTISNCLIPYILVNFLYAMIYSKGDLAGSLLQFTHPQWTLWYLMSLIIWRLLVKPFSKLKGAFFLSVLLSLYVGLTEMGSFMALARTFGFFPYFIAGYLTPEKYVNKVRSLNKAFALIPFTLAACSFLVIRKLNVGIVALYMSKPYSGTSAIGSVGIRLLILTTGILCILGFIMIIPGKRSIVTTIGKNSILVYLAHPGIIYVLRKIPAFKIRNGLVSIAFAAVFAAAVCLLFGNEPVGKAYRFVIGRISKLLLKKEKTQTET